MNARALLPLVGLLLIVSVALTLGADFTSAMFWGVGFVVGVTSFRLFHASSRNAAIVLFTAYVVGGALVLLSTR